MIKHLYLCPIYLNVAANQNYAATVFLESFSVFVTLSNQVFMMWYF